MNTFKGGGFHNNLRDNMIQLLVLFVKEAYLLELHNKSFKKKNEKRNCMLKNLEEKPLEISIIICLKAGEMGVRIYLRIFLIQREKTLMN